MTKKKRYVRQVLKDGKVELEYSNKMGEGYSDNIYFGSFSLKDKIVNWFRGYRKIDRSEWGALAFDIFSLLFFLCILIYLLTHE